MGGICGGTRRGSRWLEACTHWWQGGGGLWSDLVDRKEFESWLREQDRETCIKIATRAALRVFPVATNVHSYTHLPILTGRTLLISGLIASRSPRELVALSNNAAHAVRESARSFSDTYFGFAGGYAALSAAAAVNAGSFTATKTAEAATEASIYAALADALSRGGGLGAEIRRFRATVNQTSDINFNKSDLLPFIVADSELQSKELLETPLWHDEKRPLISSGKGLLDTPAFAFWREWYQGFLDGRPMD